MHAGARQTAAWLRFYVATALVLSLGSLQAPPGACVTLQGAPGLQSLREALNTAGLPPLAQLVAGEGDGAPVTILGPSAAAFSAFKTNWPDLAQKDLEKILSCHVLLGPGPVYQTLTDGFNITKNAGDSSVQYNAKDTADLVSEHAICGSDVTAVWLTDKVIVPSNLTTAISGPAAAPACETFYDSVGKNENLTLVKLSWQMAYPEEVPQTVTSFLSAEYEAFVLSPDDRAMSAFAEMLGLLNPAAWDVEFVRWILFSHWFTAADNPGFDPYGSGPQNVTTTNGERSTMDLTAKTVQWSNSVANIYETVDICNGSKMYIIDSVLMPAQYAPDAASTTPPTQEESGPDPDALVKEESRAQAQLSVSTVALLLLLLLCV